MFAAYHWPPRDERFQVVTKNKNRRKNKRAKAMTLSGSGRLPLGRFRQTDIPDETCIKFVYSDYRTITSSTFQGEYVYRLNSLFDPDNTGVGGQPDGFDQWKALYGVYRVVACDVEIQAVGGNGFGLLAIAPTTTATTMSSAEETAGLRHGAGQTFSAQQIAKIRKSWHIGEILGKEDVAILSDPNDSAAVTTNPTEQAFLHVCTETSGTGDIVYAWTKITYYTRLEAAIQTLDTVSRHKQRFAMAVAASQSSPPLLTATPPVVAPITRQPTRSCDPALLSASLAVAPSVRVSEYDRLKRLLTSADYDATHRPASERKLLFDRMIAALTAEAEELCLVTK